MSQDREDDDLPRYPAEYYEYQLVGIVVHQGSADSGHYYSFVKERVPLEESREAAWFEFNDTNVIPFSTDRIPYECFGGEEEVMVYDRDRGITKKAMRPKINNAYILVYERKDIDLNEWSTFAFPSLFFSLENSFLMNEYVSQASSCGRRRRGRRGSGSSRRSCWRRRRRTRIPATPTASRSRSRPARRATTRRASEARRRRTPAATTRRTPAPSPS
jgi:hypothetical protein